jgi:hypothetical protein
VVQRYEIIFNLPNYFAFIKNLIVFLKKCLFSWLFHWNFVSLHCNNKKVIEMEEKIMTNNNLQQMGNPMQNLLSVMKNMICQLGVADNAEALDEIDKASESITKALKMVNEKVYS